MIAEQIELKRRELTVIVDREHKASLGQFLTPYPIAIFMASLFNLQRKDSATILDPGAGIGSLSASLLDRQQYYQWRYVNNNNKVVRQIRIGKLPVSSISTIFSQVAGIQLTNTPSYRRTAFGQYAFNASIPPDHDAELYINNRLTDLVQSDSSGKIQHDLPLLYGRNEFKIRYTDS